MSHARLRFLALASLAPILGCVGTNFCGDESFTPPEIAECDAADTEYTFDALEVSAEHVLGGQGSEMVVFDVTFLGADPPTCADIGYTLVDMRDGSTLLSGLERVETTEAPGGRVTASALWQFWPGASSDVRVEVSAHGRMGSDEICGFGPCEDPDGGDIDAGP
ncbi:MAG: hypothetical protein H6719_01025 [Sandaracinaceae bacterium]|nr:hypothetical protein [Sandaracinaceae bacterium]